MGAEGEGWAGVVRGWGGGGGGEGGQGQCCCRPVSDVREGHLR